MILIIQPVNAIYFLVHKSIFDCLSARAAKRKQGHKKKKAIVFYF